MTSLLWLGVVLGVLVVIALGLRVVGANRNWVPDRRLVGLGLPEVQPALGGTI